MSNYYQELFSGLANSGRSFYSDNFDHEIRSLGRRQRLRVALEGIVAGLMRRLGIKTNMLLLSGNNYYLQNIDRFRDTYEIFGDEASKSRLIELLLYRMLGFTRVKLSLNTREFWDARSRVDAYRRPDRLPVDFRSGYLDLYDLSGAGYEVKLYFVRNGVFVDFVLEQYNYRDRICVNEGDVVIDAGGCWGDTALYFSARGAAKVFVYEFIPSNVSILEKNVSLNPHFSDRIELVNRAVWDRSNVDLTFDDRGPASRVAEQGVYAGAVQTLSIDDLVKEKRLRTVDFIKMDIEGAEMWALKGAAQTIRQHKPKLAISAYHKPDDLLLIPKYIQSLNPGYEFYLDYYTIVGDEIMLYAIDRGAR